MRLPILIRISNAWDALRGRPCTHTVDAMSIELNVDTSKLEEGLDRAKLQVAELAKLTDIPEPRLLIKTDRPLSQAETDNIREAVRLGRETGEPLVADSSVTIYQLADGKWQPIKAIPSEDAALLKLKPQQTIEEAAEEFGIPAERIAYPKGDCEPMTEDEERIAQGWRKIKVASMDGVTYRWAPPKEECDARAEMYMKTLQAGTMTPNDIARLENDDDDPRSKHGYTKGN